MRFSLAALGLVVPAMSADICLSLTKQCNDGTNSHMNLNNYYMCGTCDGTLITNSDGTSLCGSVKIELCPPPDIPAIPDIPATPKPTPAGGTSGDIPAETIPASDRECCTGMACMGKPGIMSQRCCPSGSNFLGMDIMGANSCTCKENVVQVCDHNSNGGESQDNSDTTHTEMDGNACCAGMSDDCDFSFSTSILNNEIWCCPKGGSMSTSTMNGKSTCTCGSENTPRQCVGPQGADYSAAGLQAAPGLIAPTVLTALTATLAWGL